MWKMLREIVLNIKHSTIQFFIRFFFIPCYYKSMKPWFVYMLRMSDGTLYTGITNDLEKRLRMHNEGRGAKYTRGRKPARLIYSKKMESRSEALKAEAQIKSFTRKEKLQLAKRKMAHEETKTLPTKLFKVLNEGFTCANCGAEVLPTTCGAPRNHCPFCLYSMHVDIHVGDRANPCRGLMKPIGVVTEARKEYVIIYRCVKCRQKARSKIIPQRDIQPDNFDLIVKLSTKPVK